MAKRDLILEIGTEEIPARFMAEAIGQLGEIASNLISQNRIKINNVKVWGTPRRLVLLVEGLGEKQADVTEKKKGPARKAAFDAEGKPTRAAQGFARSQGIGVEELQIEEFQGGEFVFAVKEVKGGEARKILPGLLTELISKLYFPKPMYWESREVRFARPIRWLLALYGEETVSFSYAGLPAGNQTYGHRFIQPGPFTVGTPGDYFKSLQEAFVVLDQEERKASIREQAEEKARELGGVALIDPDLLEEVNYLVEYPVAVVGSFSPEFLEIPQEVLITTMQSHQRFFPVSRPGGGLLPHFITISNSQADPRGYIKAGNERVLRARLADARFFFQEDQKVNPDQGVEKLKGILFQEELGTLHEKTGRIVQLAGYMADSLDLPEESRELVSRAAFLCKFDLTTNMVYEFPELQGIMGREYGRLAGEKEGVTGAIFEHYLPRFAGDELPASIAGALVSIADKVDSIAGCFGIGIVPTGSQDPYALRRQALGIVNILLEKGLPLSLSRLLDRAVGFLSPRGLEKTGVEINQEVLEFFRQRIRNVFLEKGIRYDLVDAVLNTDFDIVPRSYQKAQCLAKALEDPDFSRLMTAFTRVANLARDVSREGQVRQDLLREEGEKNLYQSFTRLQENIEGLWNKEDYPGILAGFAAMQKPVDDFFDQVMVMVEEKELRDNRLFILRDIRDLFRKYADFSRIVS